MKGRLLLLIALAGACGPWPGTDPGAPAGTYGAMPNVVVAPATLPAAVVSSSYSQTVTVLSGGASAYGYTLVNSSLYGGVVSTAPPGLSWSQVSARSFTLSGAPTTAGSYTVTLVFLDVRPVEAIVNYSLTVR